MELSDMGITNVTAQGGTIYAGDENIAQARSNDGSHFQGDAESQKYILKEQEVDVRSERWK